MIRWISQQQPASLIELRVGNTTWSTNVKHILYHSRAGALLGATALTAVLATAVNAMPDLPATFNLDTLGAPTFLTEPGADVGLDFSTPLNRHATFADDPRFSATEIVDDDGAVLKLAGLFDYEPLALPTVNMATYGVFKAEMDGDEIGAWLDRNVGAVDVLAAPAENSMGYRMIGSWASGKIMSMITGSDKTLSAIRTFALRLTERAHVGLSFGKMQVA